MREEDKYRIFLSPPHQSGVELKYLSEALKSNWLAPGGTYVRKFEASLKELTDRKNCIALNSGTAALHLALKLLNVSEGDFVICQTFSFVATANPINYLGATPIFIDSEIATWNIDPNILEESIIDLRKSGIQPKAIVYAHIYGNPAKVNDLRYISSKYGIPLIEDAAEALGTSINSKSVGQFGNISILSFNVNKIITTSGGGALLTDDASISERCLQLASQARDKEISYLHTEVGFNYRMNNLSAALGLAQISSLNERTNKKRDIFDTYKDFSNAKFGFEYVKEMQNCKLNRWLSVFLLDRKKYAKLIIDLLHKSGIESRRVWKPLHSLNIYGRQKVYINGTANALFERGICLPSGVGLKKQELAEILDVLERIQ